MQLRQAIAEAQLAWTQDQIEEWEERAAIIAEGDKLDRERAEAAAFFELRKKWKAEAC